MKRFLAFAGDSYYPEGGAKDFVGAFDTELDARLAGVETPKDWCHVFDLETKTIVWSLYR
jgi:hypothetical protein